MVNNCAIKLELVLENTEFKADLYPIFNRFINLVSVLILAKLSQPKRFIVPTEFNDSTSWLSKSALRSIMVRSVFLLSLSVIK